jgi:hypothetical protein
MHVLPHALGQPEQQAVLLIGAELHGMTQIRCIEHMGVGRLPGEVHGRGFTGIAADTGVQPPAAGAARHHEGGDRREAGREGPHIEVEPGPDTIRPGLIRPIVIDPQALGQRLVEHLVIVTMELFGELVILAHPLRLFRMGGEIGHDRPACLRRQLAVDKCLEVVFVDRMDMCRHGDACFFESRPEARDAGP